MASGLVGLHVIGIIPLKILEERMQILKNINLPCNIFPSSYTIKKYHFLRLELVSRTGKRHFDALNGAPNLSPQAAFCAPELVSELDQINPLAL